MRTSGVNCINILCTAFALVDHEGVNNTVKLSVFFALLGSMSVKAVRRTLMKFSPGSFCEIASDLF